MSGWIEWNHRRAGRVVEKADDDGHHVSQRSDAKEGIIGAGKRIFVGKKGVLPTVQKTRTLERTACEERRAGTRTNTDAYAWGCA